MDLRNQSSRYLKAYERRLAKCSTIRMKQTVPPAHDYVVGARGQPNTRDGYLVARSPNGDCPPPTGGAPYNNKCYRTDQSLCDFARVGNSLLNQGAGAAFGPIVIVPTNTQYFQPVAAECIVSQNGNALLNALVRFTASEIGNTPQEPIHTIPALAATTAFIWSDHFLPGDYGPRPVNWGIFSVAALTKPLQIYGWNPCAMAVDIEWLLYGNAMDGVPPGQVGKPTKIA